MAPCKNIQHPFQTDAGISQSHRLMPELNLNAPKIDGRTLADLLDYFVKLSKHVNYFDKDLLVSDWQPFFSKSIPFNLAAVSKYNTAVVEEKFELYKSLFQKRPGKNTLQLIVHYMYYSTIYRINTWHRAVNGSGVPFENLLENLVQDRLLESLRTFISLANAASREHCIRNIDFTSLLENNIWNLSSADLKNTDGQFRSRRGRLNRLNGLVNAFSSLWPSFTEAIKLLGSAAEDSIEVSLFKQTEALKQQHTPHLALLFAFLKLFQHLQGDLNNYTRKHLDFFYKEILRLVPRPAVPDKAHIVFEIQKQLDDYLLKKGIEVKDAKDKKNTEIVFSLDDEIVVNKAQVQELKTLFLNMEPAFDRINLRLLDGVYMAPKADKADGLSKDFTDDTEKNWSTLGAHLSKFIDVGKTVPDPYPFARIGFVLASPVFLLNEGSRVITMQLYCKSNNNCLFNAEPNMLVQFLADLQTAMGLTFIIVTKDMVELAKKKGISQATLTKIKNLLTVIPRDVCCPGEPEVRVDRVQLEKTKWKTDILDTVLLSEQIILNQLFADHRVFKILFSGKSTWIEPSTIDLLSIEPKGFDYLIRIKVTLGNEKPAVTYFDKAALKEDFDTKLPLMKIELDNEIRIEYPGMPEIPEQAEKCCFENCPIKYKQYISLYQFFRQLTIHDSLPPDNTKIEVEVCGIKNLLVRNDENLLDINGPMAAFGVRPKVGSSFYIGSKEIFSKNWQQVFINTEWKDRPVDFAVHYEHYFYEAFEDGSNQITNNSFKMRASVRDQGDWVVNGQKNIFLTPSEARAPFCGHPAPLWNQNVYHYLRGDFGVAYVPLPVDPMELQPLNINSEYGFIRLTLEGVGFQHDRYPFVLARHMMALADLVDPVSMNAAIGHLVTVEDLAEEIHNRVHDIIPMMNLIQNRIINIMDQLTHDAFGPFNPAVDGVFFLIAELKTAIDNAVNDIGIPNLPSALANLTNAGNYALTIIAKIGSTGVGGTIIGDSEAIENNIASIIFSVDNDPDGLLHTADLGVGGIHELVVVQLDRINDIKNLLQVNQALKNGLPKEAYTPTAKDLTLDYTAVALINDMDLIHLYPFENTHRTEEIEMQPALFPTHCDEGSLYIGLKQLVPGTNINLLFQLAEATANSEADPSEILWYYLAGNQWNSLRKGFEVLEDATVGLTTSGIVKLSIPGNIDQNNTILPKDLHWIKASTKKNVASVSETIGIHTQAIRATFINTEAHDQLRLNEQLEKNKLSKLLIADANIKKVAQPYESFGGIIPETEGNYYVRVSEWLRHKGRGIQKFDYERLVLDRFPEIYKVKCINHNFGLSALRYRLDVNVAPGYVVVAVIPDLNKLKSGRSFEPKATVSLLEKITDYLKNRTSPFARVKVMNPRYEKIDICVKVQLRKGKDKIFFKNKLENDLRIFLAPWAVGEFEKLSFGQCVNQSDIVRFIEGREYVDYIICLKMMFEQDCENGKVTEINEVCPLTPRSILIGGLIDVCIPEMDCEQWKDGSIDDCSKSYDVTRVPCLEQQPKT